MPDSPSGIRLHFRHRVYWGLFLAVWIATALVIRDQVKGIYHQVRREGLSNVAVVACLNVLIDHVDIETGLRGYLIAGERDYLKPYFQGLGRAERDLASLEAAVAADPGEHGHYRSISDISASMLGEFSNQVAMVDSGGIDSARLRFVRFPTKPDMDRIRVLLIQIQAREDRRVADNLAVIDRSLATTMFFLNSFTIVLSVILVAMVTGFITPPAGRAT